jgi:two-component system response regulator MprA
MSPSVGLCEDDHVLRGVVRDALERHGFSVRATSHGGDAIGVFAPAPPDLLVLDIGLPDTDGRDLCQALRARGVASPVLFLTARDAVPDLVSGFHAGGDDYLTKPFALEELIVRIEALLRRRAPAPEEPPDVPLLDPITHAVVHGGRQVRLTPTEFRLLGTLMTHPSAVVRRHALIAAGWPSGAIVRHNTLDAYVARLRQKLQWIDAPLTIVTVRGVGYVLR